MLTMAFESWILAGLSLLLWRVVCWLGTFLKTTATVTILTHACNGGPKVMDLPITKESSDWAKKAKALLLSQGYSQYDVNSAIRHYLRGGQMTPEDTRSSALLSVVSGYPGVGSGSDPSYTVTSPSAIPARPHPCVDTKSV